MKTRLITIKTNKQNVFEKVLSNWLNADADIIKCGYVIDTELIDAGTWWAIARIDASVEEKPCDIAKRVACRGEFPEGYWPFGDEEEHTYYYDYVMFKTED